MSVFETQAIKQLRTRPIISAFQKELTLLTEESEFQVVETETPNFKNDKKQRAQSTAAFKTEKFDIAVNLKRSSSRQHKIPKIETRNINHLAIERSSNSTHFKGKLKLTSILCSDTRTNINRENIISMDYNNLENFEKAVLDTNKRDQPTQIGRASCRERV